MEPNGVSGFKRRLNKAMVECRSQASFTARRLVGQMRPTQQQVATGHKPHFSYSFAIHSHQDPPRCSRTHHRQPANQQDNSCQMSAATESQSSDDQMDQLDGLQIERSRSDEDDDIYDIVDLVESDKPVRQRKGCGNGNLKSSDHFVRAGSKRRSSTRHRRSARHRQVRFQPIPQAIDISILSSESSASSNDQQQSIRRRDFDQDSSGDEPARSIGVVNKKTTRRITLNVKQCKQMRLPSAKSLTKKLHHLSHIRFNKIKLMSFNNLAHQLHQTLASSDSFKPSTWKGSSGRQQQQANNQQPGGSTCQEDGQQVAEEEDEFGWGSDFDDQSGGSGGSSNDESAVCRDEDDCSSSAGYLLEIGKSSADFRAIDDVIQDRGISGQFKRIECNQEASPARPTDQQRQAQFSHKLKIELERRMIHDTLKTEASKQQVPAGSGDADEEEVEEDDDEDDEEAELRSLEARQGFRQIRDKLKVILDQRLASYEAICSGLRAQQVVQQQAAAKEITIGHCPPKDISGLARTPAGAQNDTTTASTTTTTTTSTTKPAEFDDCQSHCSDESSSSGLDSNHSGSQDSGHSTQHSGYSTCRHQLESERRTETSPVESIAPSHDSGKSSSASPLEGPASPQPPPVAAAKQQQQQQSGCSKPAEEEQRRARFMQNRLIINNKLESMFKSRSGPAVAVSKTAPNSPQKPAPVSAGNRAISSQTLFGASVGDSAGGDNLVAQQGPPVEALERLQLLEQQRQMSIKLKQKPRRKTARRAFQPPAGGSTEDNGSYASNSSELQRLGRDSLTKQLSMVCLRQAVNAAGQSHRPTSYDQSNLWHQPMSLVGLVGDSAQPRAAQSLRQLVTEVIDDCERPGKLSALTMSILNRSDSLCSDLGSNPSPDPGATTSPDLGATSTFKGTNSLGRHHRRAGGEASVSSRALSHQQQ